jgi:hypothetical protein
VARATGRPTPGVWLSITVSSCRHIAVARGFVYLAVILDAWSRRVVGYAGRAARGGLRPLRSSSDQQHEASIEDQLAKPATAAR